MQRHATLRHTMSKLAADGFTMHCCNKVANNRYALHVTLWLWHALLESTDMCTGGSRAAYLVHPPIYKLIKFDIPTASLVQQLHCGCQLIVIQIDVLLWPACHMLCNWRYAASCTAKTNTQHEHRKMNGATVQNTSDSQMTVTTHLDLGKSDAHQPQTWQWQASARKAHIWHLAEVMQYIGSTAYASRLSSSSSSRISSFRSYLLKMAAISAASLSERPYFSGLKPYVSRALLSVNSAERFLRVDASAFSFCNTSLLCQAFGTPLMGDKCRQMIRCAE